MPRASRRHPAIEIVAGVLLLAGLLLLAAFLLPFERLKPLADRLAQDGALESFTPALLSQLKPGLLVGALACLGAAGLAIYYRERLKRRLDGLRETSLRGVISHDLRELRDSLRVELSHKTELGILALITLLAAATRGLYLSQPMLHDEAYTFIAFASRPLLAAISDYALPNNHIFHTLLVYLAYHLLGNQPWIIRLPAFVAGVAIVPLTYVTAGCFYNRKVGLLSAGLVAAAPLLIDYSANARGYTLVCALTLCAATLAAYVMDHRNLIAWVLLALTFALGFYTIPIMLYPAGMLVVWLALSGLFREPSRDYQRAFWAYLLGACLLLVGLTTLLYMPVFIKSGIGAVVNNSYVRPDDPANLAEQVESRIASTAEQWTSSAPWGIGLLSLLGLVASLALHRRISRTIVPLQAAALLWIGFALVVQRVAPLARVWMFLLPLFTIWASAGLIGLAGLAGLILPRRLHPAGRWAVFIIAVLLPTAALAAAIPGTASMRGAPGAEEGIALYLQAHIQPGDRVAVQSPVSTPLEYYFLEYGLPQDAFDTEKGAPETLWVVVSRRYDQTLESVLKRRGFEALIPAAPGSPAYQYKHISLYRLRR